ncbi:MAG: DUF4422 domain-containing protein [Tractidigestivibacter sp.]|jgi:hypothetical protein|uniref:DUF4422 domain-containing protein n=1 Tax=Tractidigestivibacter sp. TaxID=2847320 RepID=UPI003D8ACABC
MSVKIVVVTHKQAPMPEGDLYLPLQVGKALHPEVDLGIACDNTGDNISALNDKYCELTGLYWAWKNVDADFIGLTQYRRVFASSGMVRASSDQEKLRYALSKSEAEELCARSNLILPKPRNYYVKTLAGHFLGCSFAEEDDIERFRASVGSVDQSYLPAFDEVMERTQGHMCNMFIMSHELLNQYCPWLFAVMKDLDERLDPSRTRMLGYFAEHMLDIWATKNMVPYREANVLYLDTDNEIRKRIGYAFRLLGMKDASEKIVNRAK